LKDYEVLKDDRGGEVRIFLNGTINNVGVISPHFPVGVDGFEKFEKRFLPAKGFGRLILTTPKGVMTQVEAKKIKQGGVLLAFVY
jgi:small subunit ribosomal protein S8